MSRRLAVVSGLLVALGAPAAAAAAAPANDAPTGAAPFETFTAANGAPVEQQGLADLAEAMPDAGVPRCLGPKSFARTVWFRVPAADAPRLLAFEATGGSGGSVDVPDLAAFVQPAGAAAAAPVVAEPQACDGSAAGGAAAAADPASAVELRVPKGRDVLLQVGRSEGQAERVVVSLRATPVEALEAPAGDAAGGAPAIVGERAAGVALGGATLTEEDPAQPRCPAAGTVWRKVTAERGGSHVVTVAGDAVSTVTAFVGAKPGPDNATGCVNRNAKGPLKLSVEARRREVIWVRMGTDGVAKDATARLTVASPQPRVRFGLTLLGSRKAARLQTLRARVSVGGASVQTLVVRLQRRVGSRFVTVAAGRAAGPVRSGRKATITLKRSRRLVRGRYRLTVVATPVGSKASRSRASGRALRLR